MMKNDQSKIRKYHLLLLFKMIRDNGPISRAALAKMSEMSVTSIGNIVKELIDQDYVQEVGQVEGNVGRKATLLQINPRGTLVIGVSLDVGSFEVGVVDLEGTIVFRKSVTTNPAMDPKEILDQVASEVFNTCTALGEASGKVTGIGVVVPGIVSWPDGHISASPQLNWKNVEVGHYLREKTGKSVFVDNQVKGVLLGDSLLGKMAGTQNCVCIWVGSGLGGAVIEDGVVLRGSENAFGEIGHITIDPNGPLCDCGRFGCLQTFICSSALEREARTTVEKLFEAERNGEQWAVRLVSRAAQFMAMAISNAVCMYNPRVILLAGSMIDRWPHWVEKAIGMVDGFLWDSLKGSFEVRYANYSADSNIIGAGSLVISEFLQSPFDSLQNNA